MQEGGRGQVWSLRQRICTRGPRFPSAPSTRCLKILAQPEPVNLLKPVICKMGQYPPASLG